MTLLQIKHVGKTFGSVRALADVSLDIHPNEVVGLIGENGAGKSTLLKILNGVYQPDEGELLRRGRPLVLRTPLDAEAAGIGMVHQEQSLLLNISVAENLYLGRERQFLSFGRIDWRAMHEAARRQLKKVGLDTAPAERTETLSFSERQRVELAKALILEEEYGEGVIILLDEPTSVLESREIEILFERVNTLRAHTSFVFVSHRLDEVMHLSDRMYVLRDGEVVDHLAKADATIPQIHGKMVGRGLEHDYYGSAQRREKSADIVLSVDGLGRAGRYEGVSFELHAGEVLGICGVIGSGREEVLRTLAGLAPPSEGRATLAGRVVALRSVTEAVGRGIGYVPQDRRSEGLVLPLSLTENIAMPSLGQFVRRFWVSRRAQAEAAQAWVGRLQIRPGDPGLPAMSFSGGNQQKAVLAKWVQAGVRVLLLDHPTRGVDVGAKQEVYALIRDLAGSGMAIVMTGDTLEETMAMSDTVLVMRDRKVTARHDMHAEPPSQVDIIKDMV